MIDTTIIHEKDHNGYWYTVYYKGQPVNGFRDRFDAAVFAQWYATSGSPITHDRPSSMDWGSDNN